MPVDDELLDRYLDGNASEDEAAELIEWLDVPAHLERFAKRAELHADLWSSLRRRSIQARALEVCKEGDVNPLVNSDPAEHRKRKLFRGRAGIGAVVLVMFACWVIAFLMPSGEPQPSSLGQLAEVVSAIDAVLTHKGTTWDETRLPAGQYQLQEGLLHLRFAGGVMVYVEAPARFEAVSGKRIVLRSGRVSASVPPEGVGFTVETPEAEVIDFGTEFSVDVESGASEVHVFEGLVRVQPRSTKNGEARKAVDLRTSQAVKIEAATEQALEIDLAEDRFIRNFDEPKRRYPRSVKRLSPVAYYRMPIRDRGLVSEPPQYSGVVLTGDGFRPPHARGVFAGGSLRILADSTGRGGRVDSPPPLETGQFTLSVFVYLETRADGGTVATNLHRDQGNFALSLDEDGRLQAMIRNRDGQLPSLISKISLPLRTWRHVVLTADGEQLRIYEDGQLAASKSCEMMATSDAEALWFGTDADGVRLWNGRIDELAMFDKALSENEIADLYQSALKEMARSR